MVAPDFRSRTVGCFLGGAIGDALGAPVEFLSLDEIRRRFGPGGVSEFVEAYGRPGAITDDTQMTLFTAEGLIRAEARHRDRGIAHAPSVVHRAYLRWLLTQGVAVDDPVFGSVESGWLITNEFLHHRRAPGNTCLSALRSGSQGTIDEPLNDSKGCGGVMRVAPVGLIALDPFRLAGEVAALTHGHPSGYLAAGALAVIISKIVAGDGLGNAVAAAIAGARRNPGHDETVAALEHAVELAARGDATIGTVERLGEGWVAEEAIAMSVYCALVADDFLSGVTLAVNHSGDSDSTGAITGNILGALLGVEALPRQFLAGLEGRDVIEDLAQDFVSVFGDQEPPASDRYPPS